MPNKNPIDKVIVQVNENRVRINNLEERFNRFMDNDFKEVKEAVRQANDGIIKINNKLAKPRLPLWATFILALLSSLSTGLIVGFQSPIKRVSYSYVKSVAGTVGILGKFQSPIKRVSYSYYFT